MSTSSLAAVPFNPPSFINGATGTPASKNVNTINDVLAATASAAQNASQAQPQPVQNTAPAADNTNAVTASSAVSLNNNTPLTPATSAALSNTAPATITPPDTTPTPPPAPAVVSNNNNSDNTPPPAPLAAANTNSTNNTPSPPQNLPQTAATQGSIVQTSAYSSVESSTSSTIRGSGINVIS